MSIRGVIVACAVAFGVVAHLPSEVAAAPVPRLTLPVWRAGEPPPEPPYYAGDRISIRLRRDAARRAYPRAHASAPTLGVAALDRTAAQMGATFEPTFRGERPPSSAGEPDFTVFLVARLPREVALEDGLARFAALPEVEAVSPIPIGPLAAVPNDSLWSNAWYFEQASDHDIDAPGAWDVTTGDTSLVVAIMDTGLLRYHPDLGGVTAGGRGQIWSNPIESAGVEGFDDDENGFVDDTWGWDFVTITNSDSLIPGEDVVFEDGDPSDFVGHGTAVAGVLAALSDNAIGVTGTVWKARIMPLRVSWSSIHQPSGVVDMAFLAAAVRYATRMGAHVINLSVSTLFLPELRLAVNAAIDAGIVVVVAAGNNDSPNDLSLGAPDCIQVAATDAFDVLAPWSSRGDFVDLCAPGVGIATTIFQRQSTDSLDRLPSYHPAVAGTSFATPIVAGAALLVQAHLLEHGLPLFDSRQMKRHLRLTSDDVSAENPDGGFGAGRVNLARALEDRLWPIVVRAGALTVGPAAITPTDRGGIRVRFASEDARVVELDGITGDTVLIVGLPAPPRSGPAMADVDGLGAVTFVTCQGGLVAGLDAMNAPLPGWPVSLPGGVSRPGAPDVTLGPPALGDLDGDGAIDVVVVASDGQVWAWDAAGNLRSGFPARIGGAGSGTTVALSDLDGVAGVEIAVLDGQGRLHALRGTGAELAGFPVTLGPTPPQSAPVVGRFLGGDDAEVAVVGHARLWIVRPDGTVRVDAPWSDGVDDPKGPALADLDGDGRDEIVFASGWTLLALNGMGIAPGSWPVALPAQVVGPPIAGPLGADDRPGVIVTTLAGHLAFSAAGVASTLPGYPTAPAATVEPGFIPAVANQSAKLVSGSAPDSAIVFYVLGLDARSTAAAPWPTSRGNSARTGSRLYAPVLNPLDGTPPAPVSDLSAQPRPMSSAFVSWTSPSDPGAPGGRVVQYEVRSAVFPIEEASFPLCRRARAVPVPRPPGLGESMLVDSLQERSVCYVALRSRDASGNWSAISNLAPVLVPDHRPAPVSDLRFIRRDRGELLLFALTATGDDSLTGRATRYDVRFLHRAFTPLEFGAIFHRANVPVGRVAGAVDTLVIQNPLPGMHLWVALRAIDEVGNASLMSNLIEIDPVPPLRVQDLAGTVTGTDSASLAWTTPADDDGDPVELIDLRVARHPLVDANFPSAVALPGPPAPFTPATSVRHAIGGLVEGDTSWVAMRTRDSWGNWSALSNLAILVTPSIAPSAPQDLRAVFLSENSVTLAWTAAGDDSTWGWVVNHVVRVARFPIDPADPDRVNYTWIVAPTVPGGITEHFAMPVPANVPESIWVAVQAVDSVGNTSPVSNVLALDVVAPGRVSDLAIAESRDTLALLRWTATGEDRDVGRPAWYDLHASLTPLTPANFDDATIQQRVTPSGDAGAEESAWLGGLSPLQRWWFAIRAVDAGGIRGPLSNVVAIETSPGWAHGGGRLTLSVRHAPARPPVEMYWEGAPEWGRDPRTLTIHDLAGRKLRTIRLEEPLRGIVFWDGLDDDGRRVPAGLYFVRLLHGRAAQSARIVLLP